MDDFGDDTQNDPKVVDDPSDEGSDGGIENPWNGLHADGPPGDEPEVELQEELEEQSEE